MVLIMIKGGADLSIKNSRGSSAMDYSDQYFL
jgi:hypothetical protein